MNIGDADKKLEFVEHWQGQPLIATTVITCMEIIKLSIDEVSNEAVSRSGDGSGSTDSDLITA